MSDSAPRVRLRKGAARSRYYKDAVAAIDFGRGLQRPQVLLRNGVTGVGSCLACTDAPCIHRSELSTTGMPLLDEFPQDPSEELCPTRAIDLDNETGQAHVSAACIGCGLCVVQCPFGAIHMEASGKAVVSHDDPDGLVGDSPPPQDAGTATRSGRFGPSSVPTLAALTASIQTLEDSVASRLVANALRGLGVDARVRRRGDTNVRFDGIAAFSNNKVAVLEIELTANVIESPRALLEDVAILHSRYDIPLANIYPVSVVLSLPNVRSEYYQVIDDIRSVLSMDVRTVTLGALIAGLWNGGAIPHLEGLFITTASHAVDLTPSVHAVTKTAPTEPYPAAFVTAK